MKSRSVVLGVAAAALLSLPAIVAAEEAWFPAAGRGPLDPPVFVGGSGRPVPPGTFEVAAAENGASVTPAVGAGMPLDVAVGTLVSPGEGAVFQGRCEVVTPGGVSFVVPEGSRARVYSTPEGGISVEALAGAVFAKNDEVTLYVAPGGSVGTTDLGRFRGIQGEGRVGRQSRWITWRTPAKGPTLSEDGAREVEYLDIEDDCDPVSPSKGSRGRKKD